jgi:hypothetical protein
MKLTEKLLEAHAAGDAVWATGEWTLAPADGQPITGRYAWVAVPEGNNWRLRMQISNVIPSALEIDSPGRRGVTAKPSWPGLTRPSLQPQCRYRWPGQARP